MAGRPKFEYTKELGEEIANALSVSTKSIKQLCKENPHWPGMETIRLWRITIDEFSVLYVKAKQQQIENLVDELLDIGDDSSKDSITKIDKNGNETESCDTEWVNRCRLRCDNRKWLAAKLAPRIYGERITDGKTAENLIEKIIDKL